MSVWLRAIAALILPVGLSGCGCGCASTPSPHSVLATVAPSDVIVPGTLTICSDLRRPPLDMVSDGTPAGTDILIGSDIAVRLGLKVEIKNTDKAAIPASLLSGGCDIALSGLEIGTPDTSGLVMMPYGGLHQSLVVPASNPGSITGLTDLCGRRVGVIAGSDEEAAALGSSSRTSKGAFTVCMSAAKPAPTVRSYATESDAANALTGGQDDALFVDSATCALGPRGIVMARLADLRRILGPELPLYGQRGARPGDDRRHGTVEGQVGNTNGDDVAADVGPSGGAGEGEAVGPEAAQPPSANAASRPASVGPMARHSEPWRASLLARPVRLRQDRSKAIRFIWHRDRRAGQVVPATTGTSDWTAGPKDWASSRP